MPNRNAGDTPPSNNRDIRQYISPPKLQRNRRIVESDSSENLQLGAVRESQNDPRPPVPVVHDDGDLHPQLIQIDDSDDESSDSMYVAAVTRPRDTALEQHNEENVPPPQSRNVRPRNEMQNTVQSHQRQRQQTPQRQRQIASRQQQHTLPQLRRRNHRSEQTLIGEAISTSQSETSALSADESDENAADLYRSAILGVRNRPNAVRQVSRSHQYNIV